MIKKLSNLSKELKNNADELCKLHGELVNHENYIQRLDTIEQIMKDVANDLETIVENLNAIDEGE